MADRFDEMARDWLPGPNQDSDMCANESLDAVAARLAALLRKVHDEAIEAAAADAECMLEDAPCPRCDEEIDEWRCATGLNVGGDPSGVDPEVLTRHQRDVDEVVCAARDYIEGRMPWGRLVVAVTDYDRKWPEE